MKDQSATHHPVWKAHRLLIYNGFLGPQRAHSHSHTCKKKIEKNSRKNRGETQIFHTSLRVFKSPAEHVHQFKCHVDPFKFLSDTKFFQDIA